MTNEERNAVIEECAEVVRKYCNETRSYDDPFLADDLAEEVLQLQKRIDGQSTKATDVTS